MYVCMVDKVRTNSSSCQSNLGALYVLCLVDTFMYLMVATGSKDQLLVHYDDADDAEDENEDDDNFMTVVVRFQLIILKKITYISFRDLSPNRPFQE